MRYIPTSAYEPGFPLAWEGLDLQSASDATPRIYAVSSGDGNDGVSRMYPDYYVRTVDPYALARLAVVTGFKAQYQAWANDAVYIDGEAEYGINATIYDPPDDEIDHSECEDGEDCEGCRECEDGNWSASNGAWLIYEVFLVEPDDVRSTQSCFDSLEEAFNEADILQYGGED